MAKKEEYFTVDGAYLRQQARFVLLRYFAPFNPAFYRAIGQAPKGKKFLTFLYWPEQAE